MARGHLSPQSRIYKLGWRGIPEVSLHLRHVIVYATNWWWCKDKGGLINKNSICIGLRGIFLSIGFKQQTLELLNTFSVFYHFESFTTFWFVI